MQSILIKDTLMSKNHIPMLLIQSKHDGLIEYGCAEDFAKRAEALGNLDDVTPEYIVMLDRD